MTADSEADAVTTDANAAAGPDTEIEPWVTAWCREVLGAQPVEKLLSASHLSEVVGVRLADGREVVVKARPDPDGRVPTCLAVQRAAADAGYPCARPLTNASTVGDKAVHAEEWRPGGEIVRDGGPETAARFARLYAELTTITATLGLAPPLPNPEWVTWSQDGPGFWPPNEEHEARQAIRELPEELVAIASRVRHRMLRTDGLPRVLGHGDFESHNLTWAADGTPHAVHDWDSIAWLPESVLVGLTSGSFGSFAQPTLVPVASSEAFIAAYEEARGRRFTADEREAAWAASLVTPLHNARSEVLWDWPQVSLPEVLAQAGERLRRAGLPHIR